MAEIHVESYQKVDKKCPFSDWLGSLKDIKAKAKIDICIARLRLGNLGDSKSVGDGVHEIRIGYGPGYRVYYGKDGKSIVILLCGGDKRKQNADIKAAKKYWQDYKNRKK